jgi:hypothetical protein
MAEKRKLAKDIWRGQTRKDNRERKEARRWSEHEKTEQLG